MNNRRGPKERRLKIQQQENTGEKLARKPEKEDKNLCIEI